MTATPIPRTVAMTVYGDLEVSALTELPKGRSPIRTTVVPAGEKPSWLERVWARIREEVAEGHQCYVVFPRVGGEYATKRKGRDPEDADDPDDAGADGDDGERRPPLAVLDIGPKLAEGPLAGLRIGILHGKLPADEKDAVMRAFDAGELGVLMATTVIEVGVDVPNATLMVIEHAERMGLSQLHQLRGRVGRGAQQSLAILLYYQPLSDLARQRLKIIYENHDGFEIARQDLTLRGPGEFLGARQSGAPLLRFADLERDADLLEAARRAADQLLAHDARAAAKHLDRWLGTRRFYLKA
jgi:ATP-dependent DNA helicase RecG